jgi:mannan endo-1,4-beta-mannosidase
MSFSKVFAITVLIATGCSFAISVNFSINTQLDRSAISPLIYGNNGNLVGGENITAFRSGGNRLTGYNWENNYSNAGNDWYFYNDNGMVSSLPSADQLKPGIAMKNFVDGCNQSHAYSLVTLQMAGYVAADGNRQVDSIQTAPSIRFKPILFAKGAPFTLSPNPNDSFVYIDELVNYLVSTFGTAATTTGVKGYALDNEPCIWNSTHARIHPAPVTPIELLQRSIALSTAVKAVDPVAEIFGPCDYGLRAFVDCQKSPFWRDSIKPDYASRGMDTSTMWFVDYYLEQMKKPSDAAGKRLLDVYDFHWYPEARDTVDSVRIVFSGTTTRQQLIARVQAPRSLWDSTYTETSWITKFFPYTLPLIPKFQASINTFFPGTKIALTEFDYGAGNSISGGIATADVLGILGKYGVYSAFHWNTSGVTFLSPAYKLYRNYNGMSATYGDTNVFANTTDWRNSSVYASVPAGSDSVLHVIAINKNIDSAITMNLVIDSRANYVSANIWGFDAIHTSVYKMTDIVATGINTFSYTIPKLTDT